MNRATRLTLGLTLLPALAAVSAPASASCGAARAVTSATPGAQTFFYTPGNPFTPTGNYPETPYGGSTTYYTNGVFWSWGGGDPTYGLGNDSGYFKGHSYILAYFGGFLTWLGGGYHGGFPTFVGGPQGHWQIPGVDGCITLDGSAPDALDADECNVVLLTDEADRTGYFAALSVTPTTGGDFEYTPDTGFPDGITLAPIPEPQILSSQRQGVAVNVTARVNPLAIEPTPENGFYFQCRQNEILVGYRIYVRIREHGDPIPDQIQTRALDQIYGPPIDPWVPITDETPIDIPVQFQLFGPEDTEFRLCATLTFAGVAPGAPHYELKNCSSTRIIIQDLAHPEEGRSLDERIDRSGDRPGRRRGGRSGR